ncbi:hypothetical protein AB0395_34975 [Streptosporangium sp. NPDC051023]|uniref:hypothetical protein n=1 Tax=Streptosporangium sp. NPDC051023 TaxID=3155410 RepID=UPI00344F71ED
MTITLPPPMIPPTEDGTLSWHEAARLALDAYRLTERRMLAYGVQGYYHGVPLIEQADQEPTTINPMWEIARRLPTYADTQRPYGGGIEVLPEYGTWRTQLIDRFAYLIPAPRALAWIVQVLDGRPVVEVGAGLGYWAWQLGQLGVVVEASDISPPEEHRTFVPVQQTSAPEAAAQAGDAALMILWPPMGTAVSSMAMDALTAYTGDHIIVCTEFRRDPCAGDELFLRALRDGWRAADASSGHVNWDVLGDVHLALFERR